MRALNYVFDYVIFHQLELRPKKVLVKQIKPKY